MSYFAPLPVNPSGKGSISLYISLNVSLPPPNLLRVCIVDSVTPGGRPGVPLERHATLVHTLGRPRGVRVVLGGNPGVSLIGSFSRVDFDRHIHINKLRFYSSHGTKIAVGTFLEKPVRKRPKMGHALGIEKTVTD